MFNYVNTKGLGKKVVQRTGDDRKETMSNPRE
jgi:hypothetical protein